MLLNLFIDLFCLNIFKKPDREFSFKILMPPALPLFLVKYFLTGDLTLKENSVFIFQLGIFCFSFPVFFFIFLFETSMSNENEFLDCVNNCMLFLFPFQYQVTW